MILEFDFSLVYLFSSARFGERLVSYRILSAQKPEDAIVLSVSYSLEFYRRVVRISHLFVPKKLGLKNSRITGLETEGLIGVEFTV